MSNNDSERLPLSVGAEVGAVGSVRPETANPRLYFYSLPNYHADRRFDPRARGELECVLPYLDDYETKLKKIAAPGWYAVEERQGSKISNSWAVEIRPDVRTIAPDIHIQSSTADSSIVALVEQALEKQREMFAYELDTLREELRPTEPPPPSVGSRLVERLEQVALDNMEKTLRGEQPPAKTEEAQQPRLSAEDELTLTLARNSDLLPRIIERMTNTISLGGETPPRKRSMGEQILETVKESTVLQSKAGRAFERVLNRLLPESDGGDDEDGNGDESEGDSPEEIANACSSYIVEKCAANEPIKFTDEPVKRFAQAVPAAWAELLEALKVAPVELVIGHFSNAEEFPGWYASVLKAPHARQWVIENLINPANQPPRKTRAVKEPQKA
jgi:hypothetical protein